MPVKNVVFLFKITSNSSVETSIEALIRSLEEKCPASELLTKPLDCHEWFHEQALATAGGRVFLEVSDLDDGRALEKEVRKAVIDMGGTDLKVYVENVDMRSEHVAQAKALFEEKKKKYLAR